MDPLLRDADIRRRTFDFLEEATLKYGEVLPWQCLTREFTYRGELVPLLGARGIWRPRVLPEMPISITTAPQRASRPAPYDDAMDQGGRLIYRHQGTDPGSQDNVGLRRAMRRGTPLVYFYGIEIGQYLPTWPVYVEHESPSNLEFVISIDDRMIGVDDNAEDGPLVQEARRQYVTAITVRRLHQQKFRARVLRAYRNRCAVCRLRHAELLDAAHIVPDSSPRGKPILQNGLALCKIHHAAFDRHILGVRPDLTVEIRGDILAEIDGPMLRYGLQEMNGASLSLPRRLDSRPGAEYVQERYAQFRRAG